MDEETVEKLKKRVRTKDGEEIEALAMACSKEMEIAGVYGTPENDELYFQAVVLYCKANFGYDEDTERFRLAFERLRDSMALSGDYTKESM